MSETKGHGIERMAGRTSPAGSAVDARRRRLVQGAVLGAVAGAGVGTMSLIDPSVRAGAWASGSDKPEKEEVRIGFIPLTDCASLVMASVLGLDRKYGIRIVLSKEASWAAIRDKLVSGSLDAAHVLYGLVYGVHLGIGSPQRDMAILMTLNNNGQGISLSRKLAERGVTDGDKLARLIRSEPRDYVFAQTFPTGTHAMWLYYWLAAHGVHPLNDVSVTVVPPPQMVKNVRSGNIDAFCVGEPWNHYGIVEGASVHLASSQEVWPDHPEKALGTTAGFVERYPNTARALMMAVLEASRWIDALPANRDRMAQTIAAEPYVNTSVEVIVDRIHGRYQDGLGRTWTDPRPMKFFADGAVNFPYLSDGTWFLTQFKRWGLLNDHPDYDAVASAIHRIELYREAAAQVGVALPAEFHRSSRLIDGAVWSGLEPVKFAETHAMFA